MPTKAERAISFESRVSSIERDVEHLMRGMDDIDQKIDRHHQSMQKQIQNLTEGVTQRSQVSWQLVVAAFVAIFTGMSLLGGGMMLVGNLALKPLQVQTKCLEQRMRDLEVEQMRKEKP